MAECYCGCGRKLGAFATGRKSANKMGRTITETLVAIGQHVAPEDPKAEALAERIRATVQHGHWFEQDCRKVVHDEMSFGDAPWPGIREWIREAQGMVSFFRLSPEQQRRIAGAKI
jgi:hypothetical protein